MKNKCFISFHLKQNFRSSEAKGVNIEFCYQIYSPNKSTRIKAGGPVEMLFKEASKDSWRVLYPTLLLIFELGSDLILACRNEFVLWSTLMGNKYVARAKMFYVVLKITVCSELAIIF